MDFIVLFYSNYPYFGWFELYTHRESRVKRIWIDYVEFRVSINTIVRDIDYISSFAPVYTKQGHNGGVFILPQYRSYKNYLTDKEEQCIERLMKTASEDDKYILEGIKIRFSKNAK